MQLTYDGYFFPFNERDEDKSLRTEELYHGVAIAYGQTRDPALLSVARDQDHTVLTPDGLLLASDLAAGKAEPFRFARSCCATARRAIWAPSRYCAAATARGTPRSLPRTPRKGWVTGTSIS